MPVRRGGTVQGGVGTEHLRRGPDAPDRMQGAVRGTRRLSDVRLDLGEVDGESGPPRGAARDVPPHRGRSGRQLAEQLLHHGAHIPDEDDVRPDAATDLGGLDVDLHVVGVRPGNGPRLSSTGSARSTRTDHVVISAKTSSVEISWLAPRWAATVDARPPSTTSGSGPTHAPATAVTVFVTPSPAVTRTTAGRPVSCTCTAAIAAAWCSCRTRTLLIAGSSRIAS
nr:MULTISPECIES: hypothetical protein [unclassified Pseudonocardia]